MLPRVLEPEVMDTAEEARDYDAMDHSAVNRLFVDHLLQAAQLAGVAFAASEPAHPTNIGPAVLDVGTGTAQIPIELCRRNVSCRVTAIDLAGHMLDLAGRNVSAAGFTGKIRLELVDAKRLPYADDAFDVVMSNSIIHHIPEPIDSLREMVRLTRTGGLLFVRDLMRPPEMTILRNLVQTYAGDANAHQQKMFGESLHAALTLEEIRGLAVRLGIPSESVTASSDRHWTLDWKK